MTTPHEPPTGTGPAEPETFVDPWGRAMVGPERLARLDLRYFLSDVMAAAPERIWTPTQLAAVVAAAGFELSGRPAKVVSDHLRAEVNRGRVVRTGRGRYRVGTIPGTTRRRMRYAVRHRQGALARYRARSDGGELAPPTGDRFT